MKNICEIFKPLPESWQGSNLNPTWVSVMHSSTRDFLLRHIGPPETKKQLQNIHLITLLTDICLYKTFIF